MWFLHKRGKVNLDTQMKLTPFEFQLFFNMAKKDAMDEEEEHRKAKAEYERALKANN